jgi:uncharacterized protein
MKDKKLKIVVDINHPAHVHFFKNFIWGMKKQGHEILITASDKDIACQLLEEYGFAYMKLGSYGRSLGQKIINLVRLDWRMYQTVKDFKPDIFLGIASIRSPQVAFLMRRPAYNFDDTEHSQIEIKLYLPFVSQVYTPTCFKRDLGPKQVRYAGYHELAYLHPNRFQPDRTVLREIGIGENEKYFIIRFVSWGAVHDIGQRGFNNEGKERVIKFLENHGRVLITSEATLPERFRKYQIPVSPGKIHNLLQYATLHIGEGATMVSEAAVLGVPAIYINTLRLGYLEEQENKYGLIYCCRDTSEVLNIAGELLTKEDLKHVWQKKRDILLREKKDVTEVLMGILENFQRGSRG